MGIFGTIRLWFAGRPTQTPLEEAVQHQVEETFTAISTVDPQPAVVEVKLESEPVSPEPIQAPQPTVIEEKPNLIEQPGELVQNIQVAAVEEAPTLAPIPAASEVKAKPRRARRASRRKQVAA